MRIVISLESKSLCRSFSRKDGVFKDMYVIKNELELGKTDTLWKD